MRYLILFICVLVMLTGTATAAVDVRGTAFEAIPILHEGRIKPLDSFARAMHWRITGQEHPRGVSATQWLAEILFDPLKAAERPQFTVRNPELVALLTLPPRKKAVYDFTEISAGLQPHAVMIGTLAQRQELTPAQEQLLRLQQAVIDYTQLMRSLSLLLPLSVGWQDTEARDYLALRRYEEQAQNELAAIVKRKGEDIDQYTAEEKQVAAFAMQMAVMRGGAEGNNLLRVIPAVWRQGEWVAPWAMIGAGQGAPETMVMMDHWRAMADSWMDDDRTAFAAAAAAQEQAARFYTAGRRLMAERFYNRLGALDWALYGYGLAMVLAVWAAVRHTGQAMAAARLVGGAALLVHSVGMGLRIYILARPPVGTLYESVLFVSLVVAMAAMVVGRRQEKAAAAGILAAGMAMAAGLLLMAPALIRDGDTMPVLVAVLNTNFWLATHVIVITAGYGFALLCGLAAHLWLAGAAWGRRHSIVTMHRLGLAALLLTAVGTILGGIWADQSWGRFWGWDPKENGALLIVLWLVWVMHGRRAAIMGPDLYAVGLAAVNIVVALAWFGVNLLNIGLHSYGFTSGVAAALALFCTVEIMVIGGLWAMGRRRAV